jgi:DNA-directed RNA polymerase subunit RPC12/RpoP
VARRFTRTTEDFDCLVCGTPVRGDGYTNHCPRCLWSRHVDVQPGDREAGCGGLMRPVGVEARAHDTVLTHVCERCGHRRRNRASPVDDQQALLRLAAEAASAALAGGIDGAAARSAASARERRRRR